jgi:carboxymethylenebutenolidase
MRLTVACAALLLMLPASSRAQDPHAGHAADASQQTAGPAAPMPRNAKLPPAEDQAKASLNASPRHGEYIDVPVAGATAVRTWISYPERHDKAPVVIVIHEIFGLSDWIRGVADQLASEGFIAVAPDLISGKGPNGGGTDAVATRDDVVKLVRELTSAEVDGRLNAVRAWATALPAASGKSAIVGFCWGGGTSFRYAMQSGVNAAVVYYGTPPDASALGGVQAPVLGFYGGDDARVTSTVAPTDTAMKAAGKSYESHVFDGAGHGFLRAQADRDGANMKATEQAWPRTLEFIREHTR